MFAAYGDFVAFRCYRNEPEPECFCCTIDAHPCVSFTGFHGKGHGKMGSYLSLISLDPGMIDPLLPQQVIEQHPGTGSPLPVYKCVAGEFIETNSLF